MVPSISETSFRPIARSFHSGRDADAQNLKKVLIVDDESLIRYSLKNFVESEGFQGIEADSGVSALKLFEEKNPDIVLLDIRLPDASGLDLLKTIKETKPNVTVIMVTACADVRSTVEAMKSGAIDYLEKPIDFDRLISLLRTMKQDDTPSARTLGGGEFVYSSDAMKEIIRIMELLASKSELTALILGESGTGKSMLCKLMHEMSPRRDKPFVEIGCSNIPEHLIESELFGHVKGAFTDAKSQKKGLIEMAEGGTVLFDEIGDMPYHMQSRILSLIEEKRFRRVGGLQPINADVRIFAATNRNLHDLVQAKKFRLDLYYRLNVATIEMPPLRERKEDISAMVRHYLARHADKYGCPGKEMTPAVLQFLQEYHWPGNVRELRNLTEKLLVLTRNDAIDIEDLPQGLFARKPGATAAAHVANDALGNGKSRPGLSLKVMEEEYIKMALKLSHGNQRKAARLLDISRDTLRYRLKKLGIDSAQYYGPSFQRDEELEAL